MGLFDRVSRAVQGPKKTGAFDWKFEMDLNVNYEHWPIVKRIFKPIYLTSLGIRVSDVIAFETHPTAKLMGAITPNKGVDRAAKKIHLSFSLITQSEDFLKFAKANGLNLGEEIKVALAIVDIMCRELLHLLPDAYDDVLYYPTIDGVDYSSDMVEILKFEYFLEISHAEENSIFATQSKLLTQAEWEEWVRQNQ